MEDLERLSCEYGLSGVAITDHGVVHAFPEVARTLSRIREDNPDFKLIYGMEANVFYGDAANLRKKQAAGEWVDTYHITILVKDQAGLKNLYRMVSLSHCEFYREEPVIPWSLLEEYRNGLLLGSGDAHGKLFHGVIRGQSYEDLLQIAEDFDYLEVQPISCVAFSDSSETLSEETITEAVRTIIRLGEMLHKPVVATGDVHYLMPDAQLARDVRRAISFGSLRDAKSAGKNAQLHLRSTEDMLKEFSFLGEEKASEIVVDNSILISELTEDVKPIPEGYFPFEIDGAYEKLGAVIRAKAGDLYLTDVGLPQEVESRLCSELSSIKELGIASIFWLLHELVKKSLGSGYPVSSRGNSGSMLISFLAGISNVNPLPPHYFCPHCHHTEFIKDDSVASGFDLPAKNCPVCGKPMKRDGHNIPIESFLGLNEDKPSDLNIIFAGEYREEAVKEVKSIFGKGSVFRCGTISTISQKLADIYINRYEKTSGVSLSQSDIEMCYRAIQDAKRTTGQHPGGYFIIPKGKEIEDFSPAQYSGNNLRSKDIISHFNFHDLRDTLPKVDLLGHDALTLLKLLIEATGVNVDNGTAATDPRVISLFTSPTALGVTTEDLLGIETGTLSLDSFASSYARQMMKEICPSAFSDLVKVCGLAYGTGVWLDNAKTLLGDGICELADIIAFRDDIMLYLVKQGIDRNTAYRFMELVRKGKAARSLEGEYGDTLRSHGVPEWYIESCKKILYMFPKSHAAEYALIAVKLGWYKIYYPSEYYDAFLRVKSNGLDLDLGVIKEGHNAVRERIRQLNEKIDSREYEAGEEEERSILLVVNEMMARGIQL